MSDIIDRVPGSSPIFRTELAKKIAEIAPEAVKDGKLDVESLKGLIDGDYEAEKERFGLTWPGKAAAMRAAQEPTTATLIPDVENSKDWDTTQNVFIEGDNLEVLKILQRHYYNKIKLIYIDPPYNTGKDFIYPDNFKEGLQTYLEWTKQINEEGKKLTTNTETEGRFHSNWLNMMYPRLKLARNLLSDDGFIFVSISDAELPSLIVVMREIFGESNFIETFIWRSIFRPSNLSKRVRGNAEFLVCFARNSNRDFEFVERAESPKGHASLTQANNPIRTLRFPPRSVRASLPNGEYAARKSDEFELLEPVVVEDGLIVSELAIAGRFKWKQDYLNEEINKGVDLVVRSESFIPGYMKTYQDTVLRPTKILPDDLVSDVLSANATLSRLFDGSKVFDYPKPVSLLKILMQIVGLEGDDTCLDFFAGSGTLGHAVLEFNAERGSSVKSIQVQLPEPITSDSAAALAGFDSIASLARERMRRAGVKIQADTSRDPASQAVPLDVGFRSFRLADTNFEVWQAVSEINRTELEQQLFDMRESANDYASPQDLLTELIIKLGFSLTEHFAERSVEGLQVFDVADGLLLAYMNEHVKPSLDQLRALADQGPAKMVILEDAFHGDDELKTNLKQLCTARDIELWTA